LLNRYNCIYKYCQHIKKEKILIIK